MINQSKGQRKCVKYCSCPVVQSTIICPWCDLGMPPVSVYQAALLVQSQAVKKEEAIVDTRLYAFSDIMISNTKY